MGTKVLLSNEVDYDDFLQKNKWLYLTHPTANPTATKIQEILKENPDIDSKELRKYLASFTWKNYNKSILNVLGCEN